MVNLLEGSAASTLSVCSFARTVGGELVSAAGGEGVLLDDFDDGLSLKVNLEIAVCLIGMPSSSGWISWMSTVGTGVSSFGSGAAIESKEEESVVRC